MKTMEVERHEPSEAETIASEILARIKYSPELAHEIGSYLVEYAEREVAEALAQRSE